MSPDTAASFAADTKAEYEVFQEFHRTLQLEHTALIQGETEHLLQLAPRKSELIEKLAIFSMARSHMLQAAGHENNSAGIAALLDALGVDAATRKLWNDLLTLAREAEQVNRSNGILIETHLRHNQQALAVLRAAANPGSLYGANGQISNMSGGRTRDKA